MGKINDRGSFFFFLTYYSTLIVRILFFWDGLINLLLKKTVYFIIYRKPYWDLLFNNNNNKKTCSKQAKSFNLFRALWDEIKTRSYIFFFSGQMCRNSSFLFYYLLYILFFVVGYWKALIFIAWADIGPSQWTENSELFFILYIYFPSSYVKYTYIQNTYICIFKFKF